MPAVELPEVSKKLTKIVRLIEEEQCDYEKHPKNAEELDRFLKHVRPLRCDGEIPVIELERYVGHLYRRYSMCEHVIIPAHNTVNPNVPLTYRTHLTGLYSGGYTRGLRTIDASTFAELYRKLIAAILVEVKSGRLWERETYDGKKEVKVKKAH